LRAGCKTVIGSRLKQSGMFWTVRGANAIIALRCCRFSARFEDYWDTRAGLIPTFMSRTPITSESFVLLLLAGMAIAIPPPQASPTSQEMEAAGHP